MKRSFAFLRLLSVLAGGSLAVAALAANGPDVIVGDLPDFSSWGVYNGVAAFSIATTSCNIGTSNLRWERSNSFHPVIGQNLYRWKVINGAGRFEMIGQSFLKHGFTALNGTLCGPCSPRDNTGDTLDPTCSDPYSSSLNGSQDRLGPKYQVNAFTGVYPFPVTGIPPVPGDASGAIARRLQAKVADVQANMNTGALYFAEGHYIAQDDAAAGNGLNNIAYRRVNISGISPNFTMSTVSNFTTQRQVPAIYGWGTAELGVTYRTISVPGEGQFTLACKSTFMANGQWHYEYALHNNNSDRSGAGFQINLPGEGMQDQVGFYNTGFSAVAYHSGEPYSATPWTISRTPTAFKWDVVDSFATNPNANALRWGTMYSFRFDSAQPPTTTGTATLTLFKPGAAGAPNTITVTGVVVPIPPPCVGDFNIDGGVDGQDISCFFTDWENGLASADTDRNGGVDGSDVEAFVTHWAGGC